MPGTFLFPPGATTAIGSLPHADPAAAAAFTLDGACDIPFWPQLPRRDFREGMVFQYAEGFPGLVFDEAGKRGRVDRGGAFIDDLTAFYERILNPAAEFPLSPAHAAGFSAFLERVSRAPRRPDWVKGHVTGPLTFTLGLNVEDGRPIHAEPELREAAVRLLARRAAWQARRLREAARWGVLLFIDEPIYSALGTAAYLSVKPDDLKSTVGEVSAAIRAEGALVGLHCCGDADWEAVLASDIDVLSFDSWNYGESLALRAVAVRAFLDRGGRLAFGAVPTGEDIAGADERAIAGALDRAVAALVSRGVPERALLDRSLVTPSCGCGSRSLDETAKVFRLLRAAGGRFSA